MNAIDISLVTVGMNHLQYIRTMYESLYESSKEIPKLEVIFVDNCSTDGSVQFISSNFPNISIVRNNKPAGFGENNNKGVKVSLGRIIGIVNPDIVFTKDSLSRIISFIDSVEEEIIVAPELLNTDGTHQYSVREFITWKTIIRRIVSGGRDDITNKATNEYLCKSIDSSKIQPVDWAIGAALFMKRETYLKLGGFDERFFLYLEDEDLCFRAWKIGIPIIYYPKANLIHNHQRESIHIGRKTIYHLKSFFTFFRLHGVHIDNKIRRSTVRHYFDERKDKTYDSTKQTIRGNLQSSEY